MQSIHKKAVLAMKRKMKPQTIKCPYCGRNAVLRSADYIYKKNPLRNICMYVAVILNVILMLVYITEHFFQKVLSQMAI